MPAAIDRDVLLACSVAKAAGSTSTVQIANTDDKFGPETFSFTPGKQEPELDPAHTWVNYYKAGMKVRNASR